MSEDEAIERLTQERNEARQQRDQVKLLYTLVDSDLPDDFKPDLPPYERICDYVERCEQAEEKLAHLMRPLELPEFDWARMEVVAADELCAPDEHGVTEKCVACMAILGTRWALLMRARLTGEFRRAEEFEAANAEYARTFALQHTRSKVADDMWRAAHPERGFVIPDLGDLLAWLMEQKKERDKAMWLVHLLTDRAAAARQQIEGLEAKGFEGKSGDYRLTLARADNEVLRGIIAESDLPCLYCKLPKAEMNKCRSGFPGCGRADDLMTGKDDAPDAA